MSDQRRAQPWRRIPPGAALATVPDVVHAAEPLITATAHANAGSFVVSPLHRTTQRSRGKAVSRGARQYEPVLSGQVTAQTTRLPEGPVGGDPLWYQSVERTPTNAPGSPSRRGSRAGCPPPGSAA